MSLYRVELEDVSFWVEAETMVEAIGLWRQYAAGKQFTAAGDRKVDCYADDEPDVVELVDEGDVIRVELPPVIEMVRVE